MEYFNFLAGGALLGSIAAGWQYVKAFAWKITSLMIQRSEFIDPMGRLLVMSYLIKHYKKSKVYDRVYGAGNEFYRKADQTEAIPYEYFGMKTLIFWNGWIPFIAMVNEKTKAHNPHAGEQPYDGDEQQGLAIVCIRGTMDVDKLLAAAYEEENALRKEATQPSEHEHRRFTIINIPSLSTNLSVKGSSVQWWNRESYRLLYHGPKDVGPRLKIKHKALDDLIFPQHILDLIEEVKLWRRSKDWYIEHGIPWKRGWLLYGVPGSGKTAIARAFAEDLDMPIFIFNLTELDNKKLMEAWEWVLASAPCIALMEDIDNVFHGREYVGPNRNADLMRLFKNQGGSSKKPPKMKSQPLNDIFGDQQEQDDNWGGVLTFDRLLNTLDGVYRNDGVFTIITTNDITKIDEALGIPTKRADGSTEVISTRPGRLDKAIELTYMTPDDKIKLAKRILDGFPDQLDRMIKYIDDNKDKKETPAQFQERCAQVALASFWKTYKEDIFFRE